VGRIQTVQKANNLKRWLRRRPRVAAFVEWWTRAPRHSPGNARLFDIYNIASPVLLRPFPRVGDGSTPRFSSFVDFSSARRLASLSKSTLFFSATTPRRDYGSTHRLASILQKILLVDIVDSPVASVFDEHREELGGGFGFELRARRGARFLPPLERPLADGARFQHVLPVQARD